MSVNRSLVSNMALSLLALICLLGAAVAGPYQRENGSRCSSQCPTTSNEKFSYRLGHKYVYNFQTKNRITVAGNRKELQAGMTGVAEIYSKDKCEMTLQLRDIVFHGNVDHEDIASLTRNLVNIPLSFSWVDGNIEHVCASSEESVFSENIKKAILSAIMNTMKDWRSPSRHREVDSMGSCDTDYTIISDEENGVTIRKEKSLKSCDNRHSGQSALITSAYASPQSDIQTLPVFTDEKLVCEQKVKEGVIQNCICKETATFKPIKKYESIVELESELYLTLIDVQRSNVEHNAHFNDRKSILYNYAQDEDTETEEKEAEKILTELCPGSNRMLHPSVSKLFHRLITVLKGLPSESVNRLYDLLKNKQLCASEKTLDIFLDALPMAGTEGTIKLMVRLLKSKEVTGLKAKLWPVSFALIPSPNAEAVAAITPLLASGERSRSVMLGMSAMIYRVCSGMNCDRVPSVKHAVTFLHSTLGDYCSSENEEQVVSVLKAFGNMGYHGEAEKTILECARSKQKSISVRLAAIDAFRRYTKKVPAPLVDIYTDKEDNFETRIAALASVINQADEYVVKAIQQVLLESEKDDEQVVSYTSSIVKNWQETSSPLKQEVKKKLMSIVMSHANDTNYWQNSKNIEFSAFNVPTNLGAALESNIIHSPDSKVPRSFSTRMDIDLFGKNINLFEVGARTEGLEQSLRKLLGQKKSSSLKSLFFGLPLRQGDELSENAKISMYLRTMGTEFFDVSISDLTRVKKMMEVADIMEKLAQGKKVDFAHSFLFLNNKLAIQSITGRSYTFGITGSATVGMMANGKLDVLDLLQYPQNCDIEGHLQPSVNVELSSNIGIHTKGAKPSLKIVTSLHTEGDIGAKFRVKDAHMVEGRFEIPSEELSFLKISTQLYEVDLNDNEKQITQEMESKIDHCINALERPLGIQICGKVEMPKPFISRTFPYARGIGNLEFFVKKTDKSMKAFVALLDVPVRKSEVMIYRLLFDTPDSSINRKFQADIQFKHSPLSGEQEFNLDLQSPFKNLSANGSYLWKRNLVQGSFGVAIEKSKRYSVKAVMEMSSSGTDEVFKPTVQWITPSYEPLTLVGSIIYTKARKEQVKIDLKSSRPGEKPIILTGNWKKEGRLGWLKTSQWKMSGDVFAKAPFVTMNLHSTLQKEIGQTEAVMSSVAVDYETQQTAKQSIEFSSGVRRNQAKLSASAQFTTTQAPQLNWLMNWDLVGSPKDAMKNDFILRYSTNPSSRYVKISQASQLGNRNNLSEVKGSIKIPQVNIDCDLNVAMNMHPKQTSDIHIETDLRYKAQNHIKSLIQFKRISREPMKMAVKIVLDYPGRKIMYEDSIEETSQNIYEGRSKLQWQDNKQVIFQYKYKKQSEKFQNVHEVETNLVAPFLAKPATQRGVLKISTGNLNIRNEVIIDKSASYLIEADLNKVGHSRISLVFPKIEGSMKCINLPKEKYASFDVLMKTRKFRHISGATTILLGEKKSVEAEIIPNATNEPTRKIAISAGMEISSKQSKPYYKFGSKLQLLDAILIDVLCEGDKSFKGVREVTLEVSRKNKKPVGALVRQEVESDGIYTTIKIKESQQEIAVLEMQGKLKETSGGQEIELSASATSPKQLFKRREFYLKNTNLKYYKSRNITTTIRLEHAPGKKYEFNVRYSRDTTSSTELELGLKTPWEKMQKQEIRFNRHRNQDGSTCSLFIGCDRKEISMTTLTKHRSDGVDLTFIGKFPFSIARQVEHHISVGSQRGQKKLESHLDVNGDRKYDAMLSWAGDWSNLEVQCSLKTAATQEITAHLKSQVNMPSFSHEFIVSAKSHKIFSAKLFQQVEKTDYTFLIDMQNDKHSFLDLKVIKESKGAIKRYVVKAKGLFTPITLSLQSSSSDKFSVTVVANVCRESPERQCYNIKGYHKKESNSEKYIRFKKVTLDIEKSQKEVVEHICNIHYLFSQQEKSVKSKLFIDSKHKRIGYDVALKMRQDDQEPTELDISVFLPKRTMRGSLSILHNKKSCFLDVEMLPNTSIPSQTMSWQWRREWDSKTNDLSGSLSVKGVRKQPFSVKFYISKMKKMAKVKIDFSDNPEDSLVAQFNINAKQTHGESNTLTFKLLSPANRIEINAVASKMITTNRDTYNLRWSYKLKETQKTGEIKMDLNEKTRIGLPRNIQFLIDCDPYLLSGEILSIPADLWPSVFKGELKMDGTLITGVKFQRNEKCFEIECYSSEPIWRHHICLTKLEEQKLKLFSIESLHRGKKCLDIRVELDSYRKPVANVAVRWNKVEFLEAIESAQRVILKTKSVMLNEYDNRVSPRISQMSTELHEKVFKPLKSIMLSKLMLLGELSESRLSMMRESVRRCLNNFPALPSYEETCIFMEQFLNEKVPIFLERISLYLHEHLPEKWMIQLKKWIEDGRNYIIKQCTRGTLCYNVMRTYKRHGLRETHQLLQTAVIQKMRELRVSSDRRMNEVFYWFPVNTQKVWNCVLRIFESTKSHVLELKKTPLYQYWVKRYHDVKVEAVEKCRNYFEKIMEMVDDILDNAHSNENFQLLFHFINQVKSKAITEWRKFNSKKNVLEISDLILPKEWINEKFTIKEFNMRDGRVRLEIDNPFRDRPWRLLKNAVYLMMQKLTRSGIKDYS